MKFIKDCRLRYVGSYEMLNAYDIEQELFEEECMEKDYCISYLVNKKSNFPRLIPADEVIRTTPPYGWNEAYKFGFEGVYQDCMISYLCKIKEPYIKVYQLGAR